jgi:hypothetical protein
VLAVAVNPTLLTEDVVTWRVWETGVVLPLGMGKFKLVGATTNGADPPDPPTVKVTGTTMVPPLNAWPTMVMFPL